MIAERRTYTAEERREMDRDDALYDLVTQIAGLSGLSHNVEMAVREAATRRLAPILEAAASLVSAGVELEAIDRRLDNHVQMHADCLHPRPCWSYRVLQIRRKHHQRAWDRAYRRLAGGA